jgi:hypothetical protein
VKGRCPWPLDDGGKIKKNFFSIYFIKFFVFVKNLRKIQRILKKFFEDKFNKRELGKFEVFEKKIEGILEK